MTSYPIPPNEQDRIAALHKYQILDTEAEQEFDEITALASQLCDVPISLISLLDSDRQWFKSRLGLAVSETSRELSFCTYAIMGNELFTISDASKDERFCEHIAVTGDPYVRFYAGMPLTNSEGYNLGTLCVVDHTPRELNAVQIKALETLARQVIVQLELRLQLRQLQETKQELQLSEVELRQQGEKLLTTNAYLEQALKKVQATNTQLIQSEKMASLGLLTAGIAHEINNPINYIHAGIDNLSHSLGDIFQLMDAYQEVLALPDPVQQQERLQELQALRQTLYIDEQREMVEKTLRAIQHGAGRTAEIVKGLRNFSRLDESSSNSANVHDGINSTLQLLSYQLLDRIQVVKDYDNSLPPIECYPGQLNQVFMNLLTNAIQAIEGKGSILIRTQNGPDSILISITDTGRGMPCEVQKHIFDPFFTTKEVGKGTGLGLSICHGILEKHRGRISFKSMEGVGSSFFISLPKALHLQSA